VRLVFADTLYWLAVFLPGDAWADALMAITPDAWLADWYARF
jgi:hypothetical protein